MPGSFSVLYAEGPDTIVHVRAIMVCFDTSTRLCGVGVEGVEMGADLLDRAKVLRLVSEQPWEGHEV